VALALTEVLPGCGKTALPAPVERVVPAPLASGKVLVILSSATRLELRDGKDYGTGYYLAELAEPLRRIIDAGFTPVFANPRGNPVSFDPASNDKLFFRGDEAARARAVAFLEGISALKHPRTLASIEAEGTLGYRGVFIPGGHAPMQDLMEDRTLGGILVAFHASGRPTGRGLPVDWVPGLVEEQDGRDVRAAKDYGGASGGSSHGGSSGSSSSAGTPPEAALQAAAAAWTRAPRVRFATRRMLAVWRSRTAEERATAIIRAARASSRRALPTKPGTSPFAKTRSKKARRKTSRRATDGPSGRKAAGAKRTADPCRHGP
jgi:hypothetical protein